MKTCLILLSTTLLGAFAFLNNGRVSGGGIVQGRQFPFIVALEMVDSCHYCGGSIVNENAVLTAGHCIEGLTPNQIQVVAGSNNVRQGGTKHKVKKFILHNSADIGIIILKDPIQFTNGVRPVQLETKNNDNVRNCTVAGWGRETASSPLSYKLRSLNYQTMSNEDCKASGIHDLKNNEMCAFGGAQRGICFGDDGGPLVDENNTLMGIACRGFPCAVGRADVYVRVSSFIKWINDNSKLN